MKKEIGVVTHWYDKIGVGVVKLKAPLKVGDTIEIEHGEERFEEQVASLQIDHKNVPSAKKVMMRPLNFQKRFTKILWCIRKNNNAQNKTRLSAVLFFLFLWPQVFFLTEKSCDPGSVFLPLVSPKQKYTCAPSTKAQNPAQAGYLCLLCSRQESDLH